VNLLGRNSNSIRDMKFLCSDIFERCEPLFSNKTLCDILKLFNASEISVV
jgi:hypothetical protein